MAKVVLNVMLLWMLLAIMHCMCCKLEGDVVSRHNRLQLRDNDFCHRTCRAPQLEKGGWSRQHTRPDDVLVPNWVLGKPVAFDLCHIDAKHTSFSRSECA